MRRRQVLAAAGAGLGSGCLGPLRSAGEDTTPDRASDADAEPWPMYGSGVANAGHVPGGTGPAGGVTERWRFETGAEVGSSPAVVDGTVYVGSTDGAVYALAEG